VGEGVGEGVGGGVGGVMEAVAHSQTPPIKSGRTLQAIGSRTPPWFPYCSSSLHGTSG